MSKNPKTKGTKEKNNDDVLYSLYGEDVHKSVFDKEANMNIDFKSISDLK